MFYSMSHLIPCHTFWIFNTKKQTIGNCAIRYIRSLGTALVKYCNVVKLYMVFLLLLIQLSEHVKKMKALL